MVILGLLLGRICLNNMFESSGKIFWSILDWSNLGFIIWSTKTSKFHDFWIFEPWRTLIYGFEYAKNTLTDVRKLWKYVETYYFCKYENQLFWTFWKVCVSNFWTLKIAKLCHLKTLSSYLTSIEILRFYHFKNLKSFEI